MNISIDYRFGEKYLITDFVKSSQLDIKEMASLLLNDTHVCNFIRDEFEYPLLNSLPSTEGRFSRFKKGLMSYFYTNTVSYMWSFPEECLNQKCGICIDTANLCASLLLTLEYNAYVSIGEIRQNKTNDLIGYHAWVTYGDRLIETTIHNKNSQNVIPIESAYDRNSEWAKQKDIYYIEHGKFNDKEYIGVTELGQTGLVVELLSIPKKLIHLNCDTADNFSKFRKKYYKQWAKEEIQKYRVLEGVYGEYTNHHKDVSE